LGAPLVGGAGLPLAHVYHVMLCAVLVLILLRWEPSAPLGETNLVQKLSTHSYAIYIVHEPLFSYVGVMPAKVSHTLGTFFELAPPLLLLSYLAAGFLQRAPGRMQQLSAHWVGCLLSVWHVWKVPLKTLKIFRGAPVSEKVPLEHSPPTRSLRK
jgi:hypothetical protein